VKITGIGYFAHIIGLEIEIIGRKMFTRALELFHNFIGEGGVDRKHNCLIEGVLKV
jgi:hypothetical protein